MLYRSSEIIKLLIIKFISFSLIVEIGSMVETTRSETAT